MEEREKAVLPFGFETNTARHPYLPSRLGQTPALQRGDSGVTDGHDQTHCIGNASEAGFEVQSEDQSEKSASLFSRVRCPNGFGPGSSHLSFNITTVIQSAPGSLPASSLVSDSVSDSGRQEGSNSVVPPGQRRHFVCR